MNPIRKLSKNVKSLISSSNQINSFTKAVQELVYNSLDAKATSIAVRVHIEEGSIQIVDNGCGINKNDFKVLGQSHMTSKVTDISTLKSMPNTYGYKGQALASIVQVSKCVKITSRSNQSEDTFMKVFEYGKEKQIVESKTRPSVGTTVEIKGFLYNLSIQKQCTNNVTNLEEIKSFLQHTSLVQCNISMSLRDDSTNEIVFKIHKKRDIYQTLSSLYDIQKSDVQELEVEKKQYKVTAYIGNGNNDTLKHLIFLNGKFIAGFSKVHKIVKKNLSKFLKIDKAERNKKKDFFNKEEQIKDNNIPFYLMFLKCPFNDYDLQTTSKHTIVDFKDWGEISKILEKLIRFYIGDITVKENIVKDNILKSTEIKTRNNNSNTRKQVKEIVDRILGSKRKIPQVSQMHNGVKGKHAKRKTKKKLQIEILSAKSKKSKYQENRKECSSPNAISKARKEVIKSWTPNLNVENNDLVNFGPLSENQEFTKQDQNPNLRTNAVGNQLNISYKRKSPKLKHKINPRKNLSKNIAAIKTKKKNKPVKTTSLLSKFINPTDSLLQRANTLAQMVNNIKKKRYFRENKQKKGVLIEETVEYENLTRNRITSVSKKINEIIVKDILPFPNKTSVNAITHKRYERKSSFLSTYDILTTVLNSQPKKDTNKLRSDELQRIVNEEVNYNVQNNNPIHESPVITFQSHHYEHRNIGLNNLTHDNQNHSFSPIRGDTFNVFKKPKAFMSKKSIDNFVPSGNKTNPFKRDTYKKNNWLKKTLKKAFNEKHYTRNNLQGIYSSEEHSSYTIQYSESDSCNFTKYNLNNNRIDSSRDAFTTNIEQSISAYTLNHTPQYISADLSNSKIISNYLFESENFLRTINKEFDNTDFSTSMNQNIDFRLKPLINNGTYTIENNSDKGTEQSFSEFGNCNEPVISTTYIVVPKSNNTINKDKNIIPRDDELNITDDIRSPIAQNAQISDPIQICETIMNSHEILNSEFANSSNNRNHSLNIHENINNSYNEDNLGINIESNDMIKDLDLEKISHHFAESQIPNLGSATVNNMRKQVQVDNNNEISEMMYENVVESEHESNFNIKDRLCFLPKGMSQLFKNCYSKEVTGNQIITGDYYEDRIYNDFAHQVQNTVEIFEPRIQEASDLVTKDIDKVNSKLKKDTASLKFDGESLKNAKVLGQVDEKFIAAVVKGDDESSSRSEFLVLFDQHAVHERIRLETNLSDYLTGGQWKSITLDEVTIKITCDEIRFLHNYKEKFTQFGLQWNILNNNEISLTAIPEAVLGKNARPVDKIIRAVQSLIKEIINTIKLQSGCVSLYPRAIMDLVFSEACRYAIKFGDQLSKSECNELLKNLSDCKTPFQCAHGRPVMAVLMDVRPINLSYKICINNIKKFKKVT